MIHRLENTVQDYAWGSSSALTELYGISIGTGRPMAELWMGAHPRAPSRVAVGGDEMGLDAYIEANPSRALGPRADGFAGRLPFLFKILCAASPLSIQAHPSLEQAREGFRRENESGIDVGAPERNYRDANHKPELICAIRPFWGLRGFRRVDEIQAELTTLEFRQADATLDPPSGEHELARFFLGLLELPEDERRELIAAAVSLSRGRWPGGAARELPEVGDPLARYFWVLRIAEEYPGDVGILSPLLMNVFSLAPGEATYQPAGVLHAYLHGVGAELMANSDNVLRGGMTVKHVDVEELGRVGVFRAETPVVLSGEPARTNACTELTYPTPFDEFAFSRVVVDGSCTVATGSAQIFFCHLGPLTLIGGDQRMQIEPGEAVFMDAESEPVGVEGSGELFRARVPE